MDSADKDKLIRKRRELKERQRELAQQAQDKRDRDGIARLTAALGCAGIPLQVLDSRPQHEFKGNRSRHISSLLARIGHLGEVIDPSDSGRIQIPQVTADYELAGALLGRLIEVEKLGSPFIVLAFEEIPSVAIGMPLENLPPRIEVIIDVGDVPTNWWAYDPEADWCIQYLEEYDYIEFWRAHEVGE